MSTVSAASYRGLFAEPVLRGLAVADACARLPQGMVSITLLLVAAEHASMTVAGLVVAAYTVGQAVTGPVRGRLADRLGLIPVAVGCGTCYAVALLALLAGALTGAPAGLLTSAAAVAGLVNPPLSPGMRSLWSAYAGARLAQAAFALDAAVFDLAYITGPVLASTLAAGVAPAAALGLMLALTGVAVAIIGRQSGRRPAPPKQPNAPDRRSRRPLVLRLGALRRLLLTAALLAAAGLDAPLLAVAAPLAGLCLGPTLATLFSQAAAAAPRGGGIQTQAWLNSIMNGGAAGGAALAAVAASRPLLALVLALVLALAATGAAALGQPETQVGADDSGARARPFGKKRERRRGAGRWLRRPLEEVRR